MRLLNADGLAYQTQHSAAFDIKSAEDTTVPAHGWVLVGTGLKLDVPNNPPGECLLILSRSGLALMGGVFVLNAPGLVDGDYAGPIGVILANFSDDDIHINIGDRIAQGLVISHLDMADVARAQVVRGEGGFGSTK